ncbi:MAG: phage major capsid protein, partial [Ruminococcus sp.]|nr:phage major capsid protein [Ruminococcus sp.]
AIGKRVDEAVIFDKNRPAEWDAGIIVRARQAGNNVSNSNDLYGALLGENGVFNKVEEFGYAVNGVVASRGMRAKLRGLRDDNGQPIYNPNMQGSTNYALDGAPMYFPANGSFDKNRAQLVAGDFSQAVYAVRQDVTVKILTESVIQDPSTKEIIYNLAQQDMIALRVVFRMGWALPNPATALDGDRTGCPFAYLEPATPMTTKTVTFTVKDGSDNAIEDVAIDVQGARLKTNSSGQAVFNLPAGDYTAAIKKKGYKTETETVTVAGSNVTKSVTLTAST